jgi:ATP-dependent exoDNAse (exonuclease V) beta subunit
VRFLKAPPLDLQPGDTGVLEAMRELTLQATAQLRVLFAEQGACDFLHVAQLADAALGQALDPGRALMIEDGRLQHVLVDEFQDTSQSQYTLLVSLTSGWSEGDGRSLFLVGDPMQSIYRFRKADVSLFRQVFDEGQLGTVALAPLRLTSNFRSRREIVDFVNKALPPVFSAPSPLAGGVVDYVPFSARRPEGGRVELHPGPPGADEHEEALRIAGVIAAALERDPAATVAVLARARKHLEPVAGALARRGIAFEAVEVQGLPHRQVVHDLLTLTRALLHPADRVAWLGLLHAPWCGLGPAELLQLAGARFELDPLARMADEDVLAGLPAEVAARVRQASEVLAAAVAAQGRLGLRRRVEAAWVRLGGPLVVEQAQDLDDAQAFFELLSEVEAHGPEDLADELEHRIERLYAGARHARVQLMTIHKAKGLEFDVVVLPRMDASTGRAGQELFRQQDVAVPGLAGGALLAPVASAELPSLYGYLGLLDGEAQACESQRVLYVALTRACRELHLFGRWSQPQTRGRSAPRGSFMDLLWPAFEAPVAEQDAGEVVAAEALVPVWPMLVATELPPLALQPQPPTLEVPAALPVPRDANAMALGEAFHRWLELIHDHWSDEWLEEGWYAARQPALESSLRLAGAGDDAVLALLERLQDQLRAALANPQLRQWLAHGSGTSVSEAVFYLRDGNRLKRQIIDLLRTDDGEGWDIVDWKTSSTDASEHWQQQLQGYAVVVRDAGLGEAATGRIYRSETDEFLGLEVRRNAL